MPICTPFGIVIEVALHSYVFHLLCVCVHAYEERGGEGEQVKWGGTRERVVIR